VMPIPPALHRVQKNRCALRRVRPVGEQVSVLLEDM
jgi:hypothetical protein